jgi:CRP-like cAMP-binding protein
MKRSAAIDSVLENGWLSAVPRGFSDTLLRQCALIRAPDGMQLYEHGSERGGLYGIAAGRMGITLPVDLDGSVLVHIAGPGLWTGSVAAFTGLQRQVVGVVMLGDSWLFHLPVAAMNTLVAHEAEAWRWLSVLASMNLATSLEVIEAYATPDPMRRVAKVLLRLRRHKAVEGRRVLATQSELAQMARLSRSAVNAALGRMAASGAVVLAYGAAEIIDAQRLIALAYDGEPGQASVPVIP